MKNLSCIIVATLIFTSCKKELNQNFINLKYPKTNKIAVTDTIFGVEVIDNYRWLEDDRSKDTEAWVNSQNKVTFNYLSKIPFREVFKNRLTELWNYEKLGVPFNEGDYTYFYKNDGLQNQYVVFRKKDGIETLFLDPNTFSKDGTTSLGSLSFSEDGRTVAYSISEGGSDWRKIIIMDAESKVIRKDTLVDVKFSAISWYKNEGFYYSSYDKPIGSELSAKTDSHKLYYHKLGTLQSEDRVIFGDEVSEKHRYVSGSVTDDSRYLLVSASASTSGNKLFIKDLSLENSKLVSIIDDFSSDTYLAQNHKSKLYLVTNFNAPNKKVVTVDAKYPSLENWQDFIPETENVLNLSSGAGYFFANYMVDAVSKVFQYDYDGNLVREVNLPGIGTCAGFDGKQNAEELYFTFSNYITPTSSFNFNPNDGNYDLYWQPNISFDSSDYLSKQVFYYSKDGTKIPMIISHKKGVKLNGKNPTILYGYGGFNISLTPSFSIANSVWMEQGGVYAVPNLRGGGEYGKKWHNAGTKMEKQNVFDDFIAAAEYLIKKEYTSSSFLAIKGGSNGGLLVGATMTQRPDLVKVALPAVGVLDMLRYHTFTAGAGWSYDYGTANDNFEMFNYLKGYSPVHNVIKGVKYPATLVTTGDHDDRVVPSHSFKFAAELQDKQTGDHPVLIRIETNAGHGAGTPISKTIEQYSDVFAFTLFNMGFNQLINR
ncbi:MAG: prolyl oligopeptidase family serine peptidase [Flavobacteriaceae bacterium]|nr:prolyl oligopeptidase family serine peptidase [Flavobacteriaceae bacterium]